MLCLYLLESRALYIALELTIVEVELLFRKQAIIAHQPTCYLTQWCR